MYSNTNCILAENYKTFYKDKLEMFCKPKVNFSISKQIQRTLIVILYIASPYRGYYVFFIPGEI